MRICALCGDLLGIYGVVECGDLRFMKQLDCATLLRGRD